MSNNLVLFSGGRDSSYLTYKLLADTSDDITLLIAASANGTCDGLTEQKLLNIQPLLKELKKIRDFRVKYLKVNSSEITSFSLDRWNSYLITKLAPELNNGTYDKLTIGSTWEQNDGAFFKLREVKEAADKITIIRRGKVVGTASPTASQEELASLMVGRPVSLDVDKNVAQLGEVTLSVSNLTISRSKI